ncbi:hypothetical protein DE146DRAFT_602742 [Phaeosphaeria sp. MPI-PUGE-AT-0046c]|nr:hypothetical protein DE146DRAFT_602742 [Phaeosphaeria sp. MPI-PUGE-AT-0046c]
MSDLPVFTAAEVATHATKSDLWVTIQGKAVYDVSEYVRDHPGGVEVLTEVAGKNATDEYEEVGHSEDADEILQSYLIGVAEETVVSKRSKAVKLVQQTVATPVKAATSSSSTAATVSVVAAGVVVVAASVYAASKYAPAGLFSRLQTFRPALPSSDQTLTGMPNSFIGGFAIASALSTVGAVVKALGGTPPYRKARRQQKPTNPHLARGFLEAKEFKGLKVASIEQLSPNVFRYTFKLPQSNDVVGLPIGQHVAIKATIGGKTVTRSYTPTSNNLDLGELALVIKVYPDGELTGKYFANLKVGDEVLFRGPKGAMKYQSGHCKRIGMIAGGTGITPMYQLIRAICEDERDTTEVSLIFANRTEDDILLREELETFARRYPKNLKLWFMLDQPPADWQYGSGFVTADVIKNRLPAPSADTRIMLCGPPGMINASKKALVSIGFKEPGAVGKMTDEIFCF